LPGIMKPVICLSGFLGGLVKILKGGAPIFRHTTVSECEESQLKNRNESSESSRQLLIPCFFNRSCRVVRWRFLCDPNALL